MDRLQILSEIDKLNDSYNNMTKKQQVAADKKLKELGDQLSIPSQNKINAVLQKGRKLTYKDIKYLKHRGVTDKKIIKAMGVHSGLYYDFIKNHKGDVPMSGNNTKQERLEEEERAKEKLEKGKTMLRDTDLPVVEIAEKTGANLNNLYYHSSRIRGNRKTESKPPVISRKKYEELEKEYEDALEEWAEKETAYKSEIESITETNVGVDLTESKELEQEIAELKEDYDILKKANKELSDKITSMCKRHEQEMEFAKSIIENHKSEHTKERHNHKLLLEYFFATHEC